MCKQRSVPAQSTPGLTVCCRLQGQIAMCTRLHCMLHCMAPTCSQQPVLQRVCAAPLNTIPSEKYTCLVTPVIYQSLKDKNVLLSNNSQCTRKNIACLVLHRVQAQSPNTLQLLSHDLQGYVASFLGGP